MRRSRSASAVGSRAAPSRSVEAVAQRHHDVRPPEADPLHQPVEGEAAVPGRHQGTTAGGGAALLQMQVGDHQQLRRRPVQHPGGVEHHPFAGKMERWPDSYAHRHTFPAVTGSRRGRRPPKRPPRSVRRPGCRVRRRSSCAWLGASTSSSWTARPRPSPRPAASRSRPQRVLVVGRTHMLAADIQHHRDRQRRHPVEPRHPDMVLHAQQHVGQPPDIGEATRPLRPAWHAAARGPAGAGAARRKRGRCSP